MATGKLISYLRVSTDKQGKAGLGIEAQRASITSYLNGGTWELLQEYVEVESGKTSDRPQLQEALKACKRTGAALVIAKLDRLSRDPDFLGTLMKSDIEFIACDMPDANKFMVRIMAALAEKEREMISERTKAALKAAKTRGVKLGKPENATPEGRAKGIAQSLEKRQEKASRFTAEVLPLILEHKAQGQSLRGIADVLNCSSVLTASGKSGAWTASAVKVILDRSTLP
ncbi:resolvase-like serine recombinase [Citrifermentans bemidjiense Bem]|uniref:Resolvase-like serine recombinase n=1 Tax=Citrifermentans bemidjiense (strain ATCC BAA-1014 / DSM 16622 / JCM 12645 / Bem) TaxID=404380 RepID=B5EA51_CITBB|nr:recombinase family protein [Citrifermentans bemidjiense]ACH38757.1 resolvase-like serine recombinase [Citrifermentans bemidjiense Bem]